MSYGTMKEIDEEAEGYAFKTVYGELSPKIIMHQVSGKFCQTALFLKDTNIPDNQYAHAGFYICQYNDKWHVRKIQMNTSKKMSLGGGDIFDSLDLGIKFLEQEEAKLKKEGYQKIVSEQDMGNSHYKGFLKELGVKIQDGVLYTPIKKQGHMVEEGRFLMGDFNHKIVPIKIEGHITTLLESMIDRMILNKFVSTEGHIPEALTPLYKEYLNACDGVQKLMHELKYRQKYINLLQQNAGNIEGIHKHLTKSWEKQIFHDDHYYMGTELEALQMHTECDWSKIPSVKEVLYKRMNMLRDLYNETKDAHKAYLEAVKKVMPPRPPLPAFVKM